MVNVSLSNVSFQWPRYQIPTDLKNPYAVCSKDTSQDQYNLEIKLFLIIGYIYMIFHLILYIDCKCQILSE